MRVSWSERFFYISSPGDTEVLSYTLGCLSDERQVVEASAETVEYPSEPGSPILHPALYLYELRTSQCGEAKLGITSVRFRDGGSWTTEPLGQR